MTRYVIEIVVELNGEAEHEIKLLPLTAISGKREIMAESIAKIIEGASILHHVRIKEVSV